MSYDLAPAHFQLSTIQTYSALVIIGNFIYLLATSKKGNK